MPGPMSPETPTTWPDLTPEQKRAWRFDQWRQSAQRVEFVSPEAGVRFTDTIERLIAVFQVQEPDRVPVSVNAGQLALQAAGLDFHAAMHNPEKAIEAARDFNREHAEELDSHTSGTFFSIPVGVVRYPRQQALRVPGPRHVSGRAGLSVRRG